MVLKHTYDINKLGFTVKSSKSRREMKSTIQNNKYSLSSAPLLSSPGGPQPTKGPPTTDMQCRLGCSAGPWSPPDGGLNIIYLNYLKFIIIF